VGSDLSYEKSDIVNSFSQQTINPHLYNPQIENLRLTAEPESFRIQSVTDAAKLSLLNTALDEIGSLYYSFFLVAPKC